MRLHIQLIRLTDNFKLRTENEYVCLFNANERREFIRKWQTNELTISKMKFMNECSTVSNRVAYTFTACMVSNTNALYQKMAIHIEKSAIRHIQYFQVYVLLKCLCP